MKKGLKIKELKAGDTVIAVELTIADADMEPTCDRELLRLKADYPDAHFVEVIIHPPQYIIHRIGQIAALPPTAPGV